VRPEGVDVEAQLAQFIAKFDPEGQTLIRSVRKAMRKRLPTANELIRDNYNFFVIGYSPTERPSDAPLSIAARAGGVGLCFIHGAKLGDPSKVLQGSGKQTRFVRLENAHTLARPEIEALMCAALANAKAPMPKTGRGRVIIRSVSAKQRSRRKAPKTT
jgi:hypothetical protein